MPENKSLLVVDDDSAHRTMLRTLLRGWGYEITEADDGSTAIEQVRQQPFDLILMDIRMVQVSGIEALEKIKALNPAIPVVIMTAYSSIESAVDALKKGAYDYLTKPLDFDKLRLTIERAVEHLRLKEENRMLKESLGEHFDRRNIIGQSPAITRLLETVAQVAPSEATVLITGESGTGKSLIADVIHRASNRAGGSLIQINCGAIPESLIEAELFGYEQGAFTGARSQGKPGYFEMAHGGTLLLDEVGELPLNVQVKLLRFLENNQVVRVGATTPRKLDVRVVAATNRDLESMVNAGTFRKDLFFRLNVVPLKIPPLRKRADDIPPLIHFFLKQFNAKCHTDKSLSPAALDCLRNFSYPGNIRELANLIEQLVVLTPTDRIGLEDLPAAVRQNEPDPCLFPETEWNLGNVVQGVEKNLIINALKACGSQRQAAKLLNIDHSTLSRKIKRYKIDHGAIIHHGENMQNSPMPSIPGQP